jgi:hypothetical protein
VKVKDVPYALFLAAMAAIIGCAVAIPNAIVLSDIWWIIMLVPVGFFVSSFLYGLWCLRAKGLSYRATVGEFNARTKREGGDR